MTFPAFISHGITMKKRKWDAKIKAKIVVDGLSSKPLTEICAENNISPAQYYRWREQFLENMHLAFEGDLRRAAAVSHENIHLKKTVTELTAELRKAALSRENTRLKKTIEDLNSQLKISKTNNPANSNEPPKEPGKTRKDKSKPV